MWAKAYGNNFENEASPKIEYCLRFEYIMMHVPFLPLCSAKPESIDITIAGKQALYSHTRVLVHGGLNWPTNENT